MAPTVTRPTPASERKLARAGDESTPTRMSPTTSTLRLRRMFSSSLLFPALPLRLDHPLRGQKLQQAGKRTFDVRPVLGLERHLHLVLGVAHLGVRTEQQLGKSLQYLVEARRQVALELAGGGGR